MLYLHLNTSLEQLNTVEHGNYSFVQMIKFFNVCELKIINSTHKIHVLCSKISVYNIHTYESDC